MRAVTLPPVPALRPRRATADRLAPTPALSRLTRALCVCRAGAAQVQEGQAVVATSSDKKDVSGILAVFELRAMPLVFLAGFRRVPGRVGGTSPCPTQATPRSADGAPTERRACAACSRSGRSRSTCSLSTRRSAAVCVDTLSLGALILDVLTLDACCVGARYFGVISYGVLALRTPYLRAPYPAMRAPSAVRQSLVCALSRDARCVAPPHTMKSNSI